MKYVQAIVFLWFVLMVFIGCASSDSTAPAGPSRPSQPIFDGNWTSQALPAQDPPSPYFTGSGGSGMRLGILVPESSGLNDNEVYLPRVLQGALVSNFSRHSAISVLDRVSLDRVIFETLDPTYEDSLDIVRLGHVAQVAYMMTGNITRTSAGYVLQINVTDTTPNANTIASYSGIHASAQLNDFSAVNNASRELLEQMGVQLTLAATSRLTQASSTQDIGAQTSLAQGIVAQQRGTIVEALVHYHNAVAFDPRLLEATDRLSTLSAHVSSGNIGQDVRNEIQLRNEWVRILTEAEEFFRNHPPLELVYSTFLTQGNIDFDRETVELRATMGIFPLETSVNVLNDIIAGLEATERRRAWDLSNWPILGLKNPWDNATSSGIFGRILLYRHGNAFGSTDVHISAVLLDENENIISNGSINTSVGVDWLRPRLGHYEQRERTRLVLAGGERNLQWARYGCYIVFTVNANDITDRMAIQILSVNGVDVAQNPDFIRITTTAQRIFLGYF